jgi:hypothetical protein
MGEPASASHHLTSWLAGAVIMVLVYLLSVAPISCVIYRDAKWRKYENAFRIFGFPYGGFKYYDTPVKHLLVKYERWCSEQLVLPVRHRPVSIPRSTP